MHNALQQLEAAKALVPGPGRTGVIGFEPQSLASSGAGVHSGDTGRSSGALVTPTVLSTAKPSLYAEQ